MATTNQELQKQVQRELEDITLAVIAYDAEQVDTNFHDSRYLDPEKTLTQKQEFLRNELKTSLETTRGGDAFSPERTQELINRYTPLSALNKDGAGHILFADQQNPNTIHVAMRGSEEFSADWLRADTGNIAIGDVPIHPFVNHLNDLSIHVNVH